MLLRSPSLSRVEMTSLRSVYSDAGSEGPAVVYGLDRELAEKAKYKYDPQMELEAREWIEAVLREPLGSGTLHEVLKDGVVLCLLINTIKPAVCAKPSASRMPFKQMENIANYLQACTQLSVPSHDLFQTVALFENKDMIAVLTNIHSLGRVSQKIPGFVGPSLGVRLATKHERHFSAEQMAVSRAMPTILNLGSSRDRHINTVTGKMGNRSMSFDTAGRSVAFGRVAAVKSTPPMHLRPSVAATENVPTNVVRHVPTHALPRSLSFPVKQQLAPGAVRTSAPPVKPRRDSTQSICSRSGLSSPLSGVAPPPIPSPPPHAYAPVYTAPQVYTAPPPLPVALPSSADTELESPVPVGPEMAPYVPPPALVETSEPFAIEPESLSSLRAPESPAKDAADTPPNRPTPSIAEPLTQGTPARATAQVDDSQAVAAAFETATADETVGHLPPLFGKKVAFIGLGPMCSHAAALLTAGAALAVFDIRNMNAIESLVEKGARAATSPRDAAMGADAVFSLVPDDAVLKQVVCDASSGLLGAFTGVHISCSTIHPETARELAALHADVGSAYIGAPMFVRANGAEALAAFAVGGAESAVAAVLPLLEQGGQEVYRFGEDPGAGNIVKLSGNFMIASAIESCAEALSMCEKSGLDRSKVMSMLNTTVFDCLVYKGYGDRVAKGQHASRGPSSSGFQLDLGLKDVSLALDVAHKVQAPMPFASILHDRFLGAAARGRGKMDWTAIALSTREEAGIDLAATL